MHLNVQGGNLLNIIIYGVHTIRAIIQQKMVSSNRFFGIIRTICETRPTIKRGALIFVQNRLFFLTFNHLEYIIPL